MKKVEPATMKSTGTDNPSRYVGGWEAYDRPQGITAQKEEAVAEANTGILAPTDENLAQAKAFLRQKWTERYRERHGSGAPADMSDSCKFVSLFVQKVFGGEMRGNPRHQFNWINGQLVDLNSDANDVRTMPDPHQHDTAFWGNREHRASMRSCETRVNAWVKEFVGLVEMVESVFGSGTTFIPPEPDEEIVVSDEDQREIKQSAKAPKKLVRSTVRAMSARGKPAKLNPYKLQETIRKPIMGTLSNEYEIVDEQDQIIGYASVSESFINRFEFTDATKRSFRGQVASVLLDQIVTEADRHTTNLTIEVQHMDGEIKTLLERFGFRLINGDTMQRLAGSVRPPSVPATQGMTNREA